MTYLRTKLFSCVVWFWLSVYHAYSVLFLSLPVYVSRPLSANFEGISPLSVWLWLQNFNSKPNMLIYLWTKAWISQFVACHWGRGQRRNVLMNLKSGLHPSNGTKLEFFWNKHFIFYQICWNTYQLPRSQQILWKTPGDNLNSISFKIEFQIFVLFPLMSNIETFCNAWLENKTVGRHVISAQCNLSVMLSCILQTWIFTPDLTFQFLWLNFKLSFGR